MLKARQKGGLGKQSVCNYSYQMLLNSCWHCKGVTQTIR